MRMKAMAQMSSGGPDKQGFKGLDRYKDGKEIVYSVKEVKSARRLYI